MNLMELFVKVDVDDQATGKIETISEKLGKGLEAAAKVGTAAVAAATVAVGALLKQSIDAYAEYEQLVGGVDTLFKDSSKKLQEYAAGAFRTAGVSANEYMSMSTSFAASLLQGLQGDTEAAAEVANMAITDMSDNANKLGTDLSMIQNAYQGFAKQNYTMLDNLKLGYGGTKEEMQRLVLEASKLNEAIKSPFEEGSLELPNIILAIHTIQEELGITGTTALEASTTISGSVNMAKAAWQNMLVGIADENQDFGLLMDQFVETIVGTTDESGNAVGGVVNNILPRVKIALDGAGKLVEETLPVIMEYIPAIIADFLPKIVSSAAEIVKALSRGLYENGDELLNGGMGMVKDILNGITEAVPNLVDAALDIVDGLVNFLGDERNINTIFWGAVELVKQLVVALCAPDTISRLFSAATSLVTGLIEYLLDPQNLEEIVYVALEIIDALGKGFGAAVIALGESANKIVDTITERVGDFEWWYGVGQTIISAIAQGMMSNPIFSVLFPGLGNVSGVANSIINNSHLQSIINAPEGYVESSADVPLFGSDGIGTQKFNGGNLTDNSTTTNSTVGDITVNMYGAPVATPEDVEEAIAQAVREVLAR